MLATAAEPFDSAEYLFEVKWDGIRALAAIEEGQWRLWGRDQSEYSGRYPELDVLRRLPSGTVVDGELVVFQKGCPDLGAVLRRHQMVSAERIRRASVQTPVRYVLFDALFHEGNSLLQEPLYRRRAVLTDLLMVLQVPELIYSEGIVGSGQGFFDKVVAQGLEGVMAKHLASPYLPGKRSSTWRKLKPARLLPCVIVGYIPSRSGIHSILVAASLHGSLRYVGQVSSGFTDQAKAELGERLARLRRPEPATACPGKAVWVEPEVYCRVRFLQWTSHGFLRSPSFKGLIDGTSESRHLANGAYRQQ
jgi:DNA ligase D-like protein (predicted ligase)